MKNLGTSFIKIGIRIFLAYGLFSSIIPIGFVTALAYILLAALVIANVIYLSVDFDDENSTLYGSLFSANEIESKIKGSYIFNLVERVMDVSIIYFLLSSPLLALTYALLSAAFMMFVYEHHKAIKKFRNKDKIDEQTNSMHR